MSSDPTDKFRLLLAPQKAPADLESRKAELEALAAAVRRAPAGSPGTAPSQAADAVALARREWLLDTMERQRALSPRFYGVPRVRGIESDEFLDRFYAPGRPVVIEGEMTGWPALAKWTPDYLRQVIGSAEVEYQAGREGDPLYELNKDGHRRRIRFDRFIDAIAGDGGSNDAYITAYNSAANAAALAPLAADMRPLPRFLTPGGGMLWIGPAGTFTPLHFDLTNNLIAQVVGTKQLILFPPSETAKLAHRVHVFSDLHDVTDPARVARHPSAHGAKGWSIELQAGELLYIPIGWWHQVRAATFSVTVTYTNFLWPNEGHASYPRD